MSLVHCLLQSCSVVYVQRGWCIQTCILWLSLSATVWKIPFCVTVCLSFNSLSSTVVSLYVDYLESILETVTLRMEVTSSINWEATDVISWNLCYVYVCSCALNMFKTMEGAADCEIRSVIRFLRTRNVLPSEIHHQICQVYGDNAMSDGMVRKWVRMFNEGRENVHDEVWSGRPSLVNDDLVRKVKERVRDDRRFTIPDLSLHFPQISRTVLYDNVSSHLGYRKVCAQWVPMMLKE